MKYFTILGFIFVTSCSQYDPDLEAHLEAERDFAYHQYHDPEYVDDCYYYEELVCEFEY